MSRQQRAQRTRASRRLSRTRRIGAAILVWLQTGLLVVPPVIAAPTGEHVINGEVSVTRHYRRDFKRGVRGGRGTRRNPRPALPNTTTIRASNGAVIQWDDFAIGRHEFVRIIQPGESSMLINDVVSGLETRIAGTLMGHSTIIIFNRNGVTIESTGVVRAGHFIAAAGEMTAGDFHAPLRFELAGDVENWGTIRADSVTLLGRHVANHGQIVAEKGSVLLAAGSEVWLSQLWSPVLVQLSRAPEPYPLSVPMAPLVWNSGEIDAGTQRIRLAAGDALGLAIRSTGALRGGTIRVTGGATGTVQVSGVLDAANRGAGGRGGLIEVTGENVAVQHATLDASGDAGGGVIHVGGERHGEGNLRTASQVYVDSASVLRADALDVGDGGEVIVWSDDQSLVFGELSARGGKNGGDGGFVETSSRNRLVAMQAADVSAPKGAAGEWLIDPVNIEIRSISDPDDEFSGCVTIPDENCGVNKPDPDGRVVRIFQDVSDVVDPSVVSTQAIEEALGLGGTVFITTARDAKDNNNLDVGRLVGNIEILDDIIISDDESEFSADSVLRLSAAGSIFIGHVGLDADGNYVKNGDAVRIENEDLDREFAVRIVANETSDLAVFPQPEQGDPDPNKNALFQQGDVVLNGRIATHSSIDAGTLTGNSEEVANLELQGVRVVVLEGSTLQTDGGGTGLFGISELFFDENIDVKGENSPEVRMMGSLDTNGGAVLLFSQGDVLVGEGATINSGGGALDVQSSSRHVDVKGGLTSGGGAIGVKAVAITIDAPLRADGAGQSGSVDLELLAGQLTLAELEAGVADPETRGGNMMINADITTRGGEVLLRSAALSSEVSAALSDALTGDDDNAPRTPLLRTVRIAEGVRIDTHLDGAIGDTQRGGNFSIRMDGELELNGSVRTGGGAVSIAVGNGSARTRTIDTRRASDAQGGVIAGDVSLDVARRLDVAGDISGGALTLEAGSDGRSKLGFSELARNRPVTLRALSSNGISLKAGVDSPLSTSFVDARTNAPRFEGASETENPARFEITQDAAIRPAGLPLGSQFASGTAAGVDYRVRSQGKVTLKGENVNGSALSVTANDFSLDDRINVPSLDVAINPIRVPDGGTNEQFEISRELAERIRADEIRISSANDLALEDGARLRVGRGSPGTIQLSAGTTGSGNLLFGGDVTLIADNIALVAGTSSDNAAAIVLDDGVEGTALPRFLGNTNAGPGKRSWSFIQNNGIDDSTLPGASQFGLRRQSAHLPKLRRGRSENPFGPLDGLDVDIRSRNQGIEVNDPFFFQDTRLSLLARDTIDLNVPIRVRELQIGGTANFVFDHELIDQIQFSDYSRSKLTLRAGADPHELDTRAILSFEDTEEDPEDLPLTIGAEQITLFSGGAGRTNSIVDFDAHRPLFVGVSQTGLDFNTSPETFIFRQEAEIKDSDLATRSQFGGLDVPGRPDTGLGTHAIRSDSGDILLNGLGSVASTETSRIILSAKRVALGREGTDLDLGDQQDVVEIRAAEIELISLVDSENSETGEGGRVDASGVDALRNFNPGIETEDFAIDVMADTLPTNFTITQTDTLKGAELPSFEAFGANGPDGVTYRVEVVEGDIDLRKDFARANGSKLELQVNTSGFRPLLGSGHELESLTASTNGDWNVNDNVKVVAEQSILLSAGCANAASANTCSGVGNLLLDGTMRRTHGRRPYVGTRKRLEDKGVVLRSNSITLLAGDASVDPLRDVAVEDLLELELPKVVANSKKLYLELLPMDGVLSGISIQQIAPLDSAELPVASAFRAREEGGVTSQSLAEVDVLSLTSLTRIPLAALDPELESADALRERFTSQIRPTEADGSGGLENIRAQLLSITAPFLRIQDQDFAYTAEQSLLSSTLLLSDFLTLEATEGRVPGRDLTLAMRDFNNTGAPLRFEFIQPGSVETPDTESRDYLPFREQFDSAGFISGMRYAVVTREPGEGITVDAEFSDLVLASRLELQAGGEGGEVKINSPLLVDSLQVNLFKELDLKGTNFEGATLVLDLGEDGRIQSVFDQEYGSPILLKSDAELNASNGVIILQGTVDSHESVAEEAGLTAVSPFEIQVHKDVGSERALSEFVLQGRSDGATFVFGEIPDFDENGVIDPDFRDGPLSVRTTGDIKFFVQDDNRESEGRELSLPVATISKYFGENASWNADNYDNYDLFFHADGRFLMGENEKLAVPGALRIRSEGGAATLGDLSALLIRVEAPSIELQRRSGGPVRRVNGELAEDGSVDYLANEISFVDLSGQPLNVSTFVATGSGRAPLFGLPNPLDLPEFFGGRQIFPTAAARTDGSQLTASDFLNPGRPFILDLKAEGPTPANLSEALWSPVPDPEVYMPLIESIGRATPLGVVGIEPIASTAADFQARLRGGAIFDDVGRRTRGATGSAQVSEMRLIADAAVASAELYKKTLGQNLEHAAETRAILQRALDDYRALTGARRVVGFEFRRYVRNRPNSQFEAYEVLAKLDALFRYHRRSGLVQAEFSRIQHEWLVAIQPEGITLDELSQTIFPSRYVRGSDILDVFGE